MESFSGFFRQRLPSSNRVLLDERFRERRRSFVVPIVQPAREPGAKITWALGKKMPGQFRGAALQIALTHLDHGQKLVTLPLPCRLSIFGAEAIAEKTQIVGAPEQVAQRAKIVAQIFKHNRIDRAQDSQLVPESLRLGAKFMKIFRCRRRFRFGKRTSRDFGARLAGWLDDWDNQTSPSIAEALVK